MHARIGEIERERDAKGDRRRANGSAEIAERGRAISRARLALVVVVVVVEVALAAVVVK